jgi:hypothetical protein
MFEINNEDLSAFGGAYLRSTAFFVQNGTQYQLVTTKSTTIANHAATNQCIALEIIQSNDLPFKWVLSKNGKVTMYSDPLGRSILEMLIHIDLEDYSNHFPFYEFNPIWERMLVLIDERKLIEQIKSPKRVDSEALVSLVDDLNLFVYDFREEMRSKEIERRFTRYLERSIRNEHALQQLIDGAFERYPRLTTIRMDLGYKKAPDLPPDVQSIDDLEEVVSHRDALLMEVRKIFPVSLIACAWKLEHCQQKGYGYHVLFLFDGTKVSDDIATGTALGEVWDRAVTKGAGVHYNHNANKKTVNFNHVGVISHRHTKVQRMFKERVLNYMAKADYFMQIRSDLADQAFGIVCFANLPLAALSGTPPVLPQ